MYYRRGKVMKIKLTLQAIDFTIVTNVVGSEVVDKKHFINNLFSCSRNPYFTYAIVHMRAIKIVLSKSNLISLVKNIRD